MADNYVIKDGNGTSVTFKSTDNAGVQIANNRISDGTNFLPSMDAVARAGFQKITDGTNTMPSGDAVARPIYVAPMTNGGQTALTASSANAAAANNQTLAGAAGKTTFISGFEITGAGATAGSTIAVTVTGTITGTLNYRLVIPAGAGVAIVALIVMFSVPIPASAVNTAIVVNVPSFGAGNLDAAVVAHGFQQ